MKTIHSLIPLMLITLSGLMSVQCTEKIDIKLGINIPRLVVDGVITNEDTIHAVRLMTTTDYFYTSVAPPVTQASVTINDGASTITLIEKPVNSGIYLTPGKYGGIPGKKYTLNINLKNAINGQTIYSASEVMPISYHPDSIKMVHRDDMDAKGLWIIQLYIQDPAEVNFYGFRGFRNDTLISDHLSTVEINDDKFFNGSYVWGMSALSWDQSFKLQTYNARDRIKLQVGSLTKEYFAFINEVKLEVASKNPLFSGPSSNVSTNISKGGMGYFAATAVSYVSTKK